MTVIFKSDKSVNYEPLIQVSQGIIMDFRQGTYVVDGVPKKLTDLLSVTTNTKRGFYDLAGSYNEVAEKTAKLAISPYNKKRGLHKEAATNANLLSEVALSLPEKYTKTLNSTGVNHYVLSLQGGGSIIVEDIFGVSHTVKQNQPAVIPTNSSNPSITLDMQRKGSVDYVALHSNSRYNAPPVNRNTTTGVLAGDSINVKNITNNPKTIIVSYSMRRGDNALTTEADLWLFSVKGFDYSLFIGFKATTGQILLNLHKAGGSFSYFKAFRPSNSSGVFSVKIEASTVSIYHSGVFLTSYAVSLSAVTALTLATDTNLVSSIQLELNAYIHEVYITPDVISDADLLGLSVN